MPGWLRVRKCLTISEYEYAVIIVVELFVFADLQRPLLSCLQDCQAVIPLPANCPSQSIVDVSENLRAKLYSIFNKIGGCNHSPYYSIRAEDFMYSNF